jgi:hypothetical protein
VCGVWGGLHADDSVGWSEPMRANLGPIMWALLGLGHPWVRHDLAH